MQIAICDADQFHTLLTALIGELTQANDHFRLVRDLDAAHKDFAREINESQTFWYLTRRAHVERVGHGRLIAAQRNQSAGLHLRPTSSPLPEFDP
jgi:hypothetical protein